MAERMRVLLAESDRSVSLAVANALRARGVDVMTANDAAHAMNMARKERPDAIVMSERLAGGAVPTLRRIRSNVYTTHIPVVALAGAGEPCAQMTAAGAQECVPPGADPGGLEEAVRRNMLKDLDFTHAPREEILSPQRLQDVRDCGLLDTPPEPRFDLLTSLAASLCDAPTALVSLVDKDRQFFKSQTGLAQPWAGARQTRLSHSFCQWVVAGKECVVVQDAHEIPALSANLAVRDMGVIAYAGIPIQGRRGQAIGSFCAIDSKPREWSAEDIATLEDLARIAQGYAVLDQARKYQANVRDTGAFMNLETSAHVAGNAILGANNIIRRHGSRLTEEQRGALLAIIEEQSRHLAQLP
ncbi:MAG TPA: GAF domain-containing protein [Usitatibacter sp.]|nr:GAF domain-containing protein [Usitatibacter sp.]